MTKIIKSRKIILMIYSDASTIHHHDVVILEDDCMEQVEVIEYVDTQENLKTGRDDMSVASLYLDETDGKYGTWKRRKLDR